MAKKLSYNQLCWNKLRKKYEVCTDTIIPQTPDPPCDGCGGGQGPTALCCIPTACCLECDVLPGIAQCLQKFNDRYRPGSVYSKTAYMPIYNVFPGFPGVGVLGAQSTPDINQLKAMLEFDDLFTDPCGYSFNASDPVIVKLPGNESQAPCYSAAGGLDVHPVISIFDVYAVCLEFTSADPNCPNIAICWEWFFTDAGALVSQPPGTTFFNNVRDVRICLNPGDVRQSQEIKLCQRCSGTSVVPCEAQITGPILVTATKAVNTTNYFTYKFNIPACCNATTMQISQPQVLSPFGGSLDFDPIPGSYPVIVPISTNVPMVYTIPPGHGVGPGREFEATFQVIPDNPACGVLNVTLFVTVTP